MQWRYRHTVLALAVAANFGQLGSRLVISPVVPDLIEAFDASKAGIGLVLTVMWAIYALLQFPSGVLGDVYGERRVALVALGLTGAGSLLLAFAPSYLLFGLFALFLGAGAGLYFTTATSLLAKQFRNSGRALSVHTAGGSLAGLVAPVVAGAVAVRLGWRPAILLGAVAVLPVALLFAWRIRPVEPAGGTVGERIDPGVVLELLARPRVAYTAAMASATVFVWQSFASFFPTFLIEYWSFSTGSASLAFGVVFLLSALAQPAMGSLSDRIGRDAALGSSVVVAAGGFVLILAGSSLLSAAVAVGLLGIGISWPGVIQARFMDAFADAERGSGFGLVRTVYMFLGALGSVVTGTLADAAGWTVAFGLVAGLLVVVAASLLANRVLRLGL